MISRYNALVYITGDNIPAWSKTSNMGLLHAINNTHIKVIGINVVGL